ncbi:hypothetical protein Kalk_13500 [Ketobacter alkanivorans]|uniref:histidine kinase n=1 Tax=Ketobacter alkanivorans TaxID=1917421 RepID=A0A2K9LRD0_9GAMM|nr:hypothetical protein Kalk_13500 [Ketobacter alkanivorans]
MEGLLNQLLNCGWDEDKTDPIQLRRIRTITGTSLLLILLGIPFLLRAYEWHISLRMVTVPAAMLLAITSIAVLGWFKNYHISTQLVVLAIYVAGAGAVLTSGGVGTSAVGWWFLVPLLAGLLRGMSSGLSWGAIVLLSMYACYWAEGHGIPLPDLTPPEHVAAQQLMQALGVTCATLILISNYLGQIGHSERILAEHNERLSRQVERAETAERELTVAVESKTRFLANMSHEMKTPLNAILGFSKRLQHRASDKLDEREQLALGQVVNHSGNMLALVNDLLALAQLDAETPQEPKRSPLDLKELLVRTTQELAPVAGRFDLQLMMEAEDSLVIEANGEQITQAVGALVRHALMYAKQGVVRLTLGEMTQGALIQVLYPGELSEAGKQRLFDRYNHLHSQNGRDVGMSGLALALAQEHVLLHGGRIGVSSDPAASNVCFNLYLPS